MFSTHVQDERFSMGEMRRLFLKAESLEEISPALRRVDAYVKPCKAEGLEPLVLLSVVLMPIRSPGRLKA